MRKEITRKENPKLHTNDSLTIKKAMKEIKRSEITDLTPISGLKLQKFSFAIDDASQISKIEEYLKTFYESVKMNTNETYTYKNLVDKDMIQYVTDLEGMLVGKINDITYSYNILAEYEKGTTELKINRKHSKAIFKYIETLTEEEYKENEGKIQRMMEKKAIYKYKSPYLSRLIIDIYVFWK